MLWRAHGQCENYGQLIGHKGAVLDLHWSRDTRLLLSASADATVASWDTETGQRIRRHEGHDGVVNSMDVSKRGMEMFISGGDDGTIGVSQKNVCGLAAALADTPCPGLGPATEGGSQLHGDRISRHSSGASRSWQ